MLSRSLSHSRVSSKRRNMITRFLLFSLVLKLATVATKQADSSTKAGACDDQARSSSKAKAPMSFFILSVLIFC